MHVEIQIPGAERIEALRAYIRRRLESALGRFADHVHRASVRISEFSGPTRGMVLTSCRVEVEVGSVPGTFVGAACEPNPYRAVDSAIERLRLLPGGEVRQPERTKPEHSAEPETAGMASGDRAFGRADAVTQAAGGEG